MKVYLQILVLVAVSIPLFSSGLVAQPPGDAAFKKVKLLKKRLELTDQQADSLYSILKEYDYSQCKEIDSFTKKSECFDKVRTSKDAKMKSVLTDSQKAELDVYIEECKVGHGPAKSAPKKEASAKVSCSS